METVEIITIILLLLGEFACLYLVNHTKKLAENTADILQNRAKEYEAEKGKNLATKEDIEEITKKMEEVRTEVSLSKQKKYERLNEQERILVDILNEATKISQSQNKLVLYLYDTSSRVRYDDLVEFVNDTLTHFYHLCNHAVVSIPIEGLDKVVENLSFAVTYLSLNVNVLASNAANLVEQFNNQWNYALNQTTTEQNKVEWMQNSLKTKQQIEGMRDKPVEGKEQLSKAIDEYCLWLKQLYGKEFFVFKS